MAESESRKHVWIGFIATLLIIIGVYASIRTVTNMMLFPKYPQNGVISINTTGQPIYYQRDEDCDYPRSYYAPDGSTRQASSEEKLQEERDKKSCLNNVNEARQNAKINDINTSLMFLFVGVGLLISKKMLLK